VNITGIHRLGVGNRGKPRQQWQPCLLVRCPAAPGMLLGPPIPSDGLPRGLPRQWEYVVNEHNNILLLPWQTMHCRVWLSERPGWQLLLAVMAAGCRR
jgi:hypothetical protein